MPVKLAVQFSEAFIRSRCKLYLMKQDQPVNFQRSLPDADTMYRALVQKDSTFEGIFVAAITSTGIFCRPTCAARKPKKQNVEFFASASEARSKGYRPCKLCRPLELYGDPPDWLKLLLQEIEQEPGIRLTDADLRQRKIEPARIRRWFNKYHGMTFQTFQRARRINMAYTGIKNEAQVTPAAFAAGYDSLSGFNSAFRKQTGFVPSDSNNGTIITIQRILTPLGPMLAGALDEGICLLEFTGSNMPDALDNEPKKHQTAGFVQGNHPHLAELQQQLQEYFEGKRKNFDIPLYMVGTSFQKNAWQALLQIPYGETRSYKEQARMIGNEKAVRAVARANAVNRMAVIIPCHRVIASDGSLAGFGAGIWRKRYLLELENNAGQTLSG
jgi:AraC family transcriptional regulator of adaptative response/methylated-DNA-[protein]-cysteine methyltransferase